MLKLPVLSLFKVDPRAEFVPLLFTLCIAVKPHPDHVQWNQHLNGYGTFQTDRPATFSFMS